MPPPGCDILQSLVDGLIDGFLIAVAAIGL
ncbi:hypothetical protein CDEF62S_05706 [Castellaniella defragrans]